MLGREIESRDAIKEQEEEEKWFRKKMKILGGHTDVYLCGEKLEDYHYELDMMTKQLVLDLRLKVFDTESIPE